MKFLFFVLVFLWGSFSFAQDLCFENEWNVETDTVFSSDEWQEVRKLWADEEPAHPGMFQLYRAYRLYKSELKTSKKLKGDKRRHCYMGCVMTQKLSFKVAEYVAWYKEEQDLNDCSRKTTFEHADFLFTIDGAEMAENLSGSASCFDSCKSVSRSKF